MLNSQIKKHPRVSSFMNKYNYRYINYYVIDIIYTGWDNIFKSFKAEEKQSQRQSYWEHMQKYWQYIKWLNAILRFYHNLKKKQRLWSSASMFQSACSSFCHS